MWPRCASSNIRSERGKDNSDYDKLSPEQMDDVVDTFSDVLRPGGDVILFCAAQQFNEWSKRFAEARTTQWTISMPGFKVDTSPSYMLRKAGITGQKQTGSQRDESFEHLALCSACNKGPLWSGRQFQDYVPIVWIRRFKVTGLFQHYRIIDEIPRLTVG